MNGQPGASAVYCMWQTENGSFQAEHLINRLFGKNLNTQPFEWNEPEN